MPPRVVVGHADASCEGRQRLAAQRKTAAARAERRWRLGHTCSMCTSPSLSPYPTHKCVGFCALRARPQVALAQLISVQVRKTAADDTASKVSGYPLTEGSARVAACLPLLLHQALAAPMGEPSKHVLCAEAHRWGCSASLILVVHCAVLRAATCCCRWRRTCCSTCSQWHGRRALCSCPRWRLQVRRTFVYVI